MSEKEATFTENPFKKYWRPAAAIVYLSICIFDFIIMPVYIEHSNVNKNFENAIILSLKYTDPQVQIKALDTFAKKRSWEPLTLVGGGLFHVSFGAILGVAAWTRGREKQINASNGIIMN